MTIDSFDILLDAVGTYRLIWVTFRNKIVISRAWRQKIQAQLELRQIPMISMELVSVVPLVPDQLHHSIIRFYRTYPYNKA